MRTAVGYPTFTFSRKVSNMEDSAMTIEFLRARLLSERSVSKSARQRADELAKRVAELEEQLKIVSIQRRRAEKATAEILAILENNGVSDISEELDSSSDQDGPFEPSMDNGSTKEENSVSSKVRKKESEELSGSDLDFSPVFGRSLSWKGRGSALHPPEKYKESLVKRRNSFASMAFSSPKHRQGKSCRQIRRRESRLVAEELESESGKVNPQGNGLVRSSEVNTTNHSESEPDILRMHSEIYEDKGSVNNLHSDALKDERNMTTSGLDFHGYEGEKDMEKALEHQAQLIGRYEAMERAQREWEEKFRENNSSTPDSCDPGNHSDVTEERDEIRIQAQYVSGTASSQGQEAEGENICFSRESPKTHSVNVVPSSQGDVDQLQDQSCCSSLSLKCLNPKPQGQKMIFSMPEENYCQESLQSNHSPLHSCRHSEQGDEAVQPFSSDMGSSSSCIEPPPSKNALVPYGTSGSFTGVLDTLKQAKLSLQQKIKALPLIEGASGGKTTEPSLSGRKVGEMVEIPVGCSGLFRVPTDFSEGSSIVNFMGLGSQLSFANYYPDAGITATSSNHFLTTSYMNTLSSSSSNYKPVTSDRFFSSPYMDTGSSSSTIPTANASPGYINNDQIPSSRYVDTGSRIHNWNPSFDPYLGPSLPASSLPSYPAFLSYPDLVPQINSKEGFPAKEGFPVFHTTRSVQEPPDHQFSFYNNHFRPDTYRL